jgi:hypothetical protein
MSEKIESMSKKRDHFRVSFQAWILIRIQQENLTRIRNLVYYSRSLELFLSGAL